MIDVVASLQWAGADVVAAYQFPIEVTAQNTGGLSTRRRRRQEAEEQRALVTTQQARPVELAAVKLQPLDVDDEVHMLLATTTLLLMH